MANSRVALIDQSLESALGHHLEYTHATRQAFIQAGLQTSVFAHRNCPPHLASAFDLTPWFSEGWSERKKLSILLSFFWALLPHSYSIFNRAVPLPKGSFGRELRDLISTQALKDSDHIFIHTLNFVQMLQTVQLASMSHTNPTFHIVLRQDPGDSPRGGLKRHLMKIAFRAISGKKGIYFYSDTKALCREYGRQSGVLFRRLPILFDRTGYRQTLDPEKPTLNVVYLGDGRNEKGFQHLPEIVRETKRRTSRLRFNFQCFLTRLSEQSSELVAARMQLQSLAKASPLEIQLLEDALSPEQYIETLLAADIVLIPYCGTAYRWRSSGILAQALVAGKVVILPSGTSLAEDTPPSLCREFTKISEIPTILEALVDDFPEPETRKSASRTFGQKHSAERFIESLELR